MSKTEEKKDKPTKKNSGKTKETATSFDYKDYVEKTFERPKAFLYYILVNDLTFKSKEEVNKTYELFKQLGGN